MPSKTRESFVRSALVAAALLMGALASGQQKYANQTVTMNVGIVLIDSYQQNGVLANDAPFVWYNLDSNARLKPSGWNFVNPGHPGSLTQTAYNRWSTLQGNTNGFPSVGSSLLKSDAPYWEVFLDQLTDQQISNYDILLLPAHGYTALNTIERGRLRKFVDKGGILWVDLNGNSNFNNGGNDYLNNLPLPFEIVGGAAGFDALYYDPIMSFPETIDSMTLNAMGTSSICAIKPVSPADLSGLASIESDLQRDSQALAPIVVDSNNHAIVAVGRLGDGYEVVTTHGIGNSINSVLGVPSNSSMVGATPVFDENTDASAKLAFNIAYLAADCAQQGKGSRKLTSGPIDIGAPLLQDFNDATRAYTPQGSKSYVPPAVFKNRVVITDQNQIFVYNAHPGSDLGLGSIDYGISDFSLGSSYDLIWESKPLNGPISAPTCVNVPENGSHPDQIWVVDDQGNLQGFDLVPDASQNLQSVNPVYTITPPSQMGGSTTWTTGVDQPGPYPPTFHDGLLFVSDVLDPTDGGVWVANPVLGTNLVSVATGSSGWFTGGLQNSVITDVSGPPTVGDLDVFDNSMAVDSVVYLPLRPDPSASTNAGFVSLWFASHGEVPTQATALANGLQVATRASSAGLNIFLPDPSDDPSVQGLGPKLSLLDANGNPVPQSVMSQIFDGTVTGTAGSNFGIITFGFKNASLWSSSYSVRVDYTIDWGGGQPSTTTQVMRGSLFLPDDQNHARHILNNIAMGPDGTLYLVTSTADCSTEASDGGSYFAIQEQGRGNFVVRTRWDMYDTHTITMNGTNDVSWKPAVLNGDPLTQLVPVLAGTFGNLTFTSSPDVANGIVYITAQGATNNGGIPNTILLAFNAEPNIPEIRTSDLGVDFTLLQPDILRSANKDTPENFSVAMPSQYDNETAGSTTGAVRFNNLSSQNRGAIVNCLSVSQPVIIRKGNSPDILLDPSTTGNNWNPLLWYTVFAGVGVTPTAGNPQVGEIGPPFVTGNTVFVPGASALPSILSGGAATNSGILLGVNANVSPTDPFLAQPDPNRPYLNQVVQVMAGPNGPISTTNISPNPDIQWPQLVGVTSVNDLRIRILQSTLGSSTIAYGAVSGDDGLYAWSDQGLFGFSKPDFLVADEGRLAEFDSVGNPIWATDKSFSSSIDNSGGAVNVRPLVRPVRAYSMSKDQVIVVDPGSNRLAILDRSGRESRSLDRFSVDPSYVPDGYVANEPLTFSSPSDVKTYTEYRTSAQNPFTPNSPTEYWVHYLVADGGNKRLVDLVDRYTYNTSTQQIGQPVVTGNGGAALGELYWHTPKEITGSRFTYTSVDLVNVVSGSGGSQTSTPEVVAGVGNIQPSNVGAGLSQDSANPGYTPNQEDAGTGNGGILIIDPTGKQTPQVISSVTVPGIATGTLFQSNTASSNPEITGSFALPQTAIPPTTKLIHALTSVTAHYLDTGGASQLAIMFTDASGAYEIVGSGSSWSVDWMLPRTVMVSPGVNAPVYTVIRRDGSDQPTTENPLDFHPVYARRLNSGDILVVNGYYGRFRKAAAAPQADFTGEVLEFDGGNSFNPNAENLGFNSLSIKFELPPITGTRGIVLPIFAGRR